jgi:DNA-binding CsgD family transcriptional regulator/PAS domain-containing protein
MYENPEVIFGGGRSLHQLISLIYGAVGEPSLWQAVMDAIAEVSNSGCTCLLANSEKCTAGSLVALTRADPSYLASYAEHYASVNVLADRCDQMFPDGTVRYSHLAVPDAAFEKTEFYNDYFRPENYYYSFGIKLPLPGDRPAYITSLRPKDLGPYRVQDGAVLETLMPHLQRALDLHFTVVGLRSGLHATLDGLPHGLVLLDTRGRCVLMNAAAQKIIDRRDGLRLSRSTLAAEVTAETTRMRALIGRACGSSATERVTGSYDAMLVSRQTKQPLQVVVAPYWSGLGDVPPTVVTTISIYDPEQEANRSLGVLRSLYGLTKAEARLTSLLLEGKDVSAAAEQSHISRETARSQLKSIFSKTGTRRQSELIRLLKPVSDGTSR